MISLTGENLIPLEILESNVNVPGRKLTKYEEFIVWNEIFHLYATIEYSSCLFGWQIVELKSLGIRFL